MNQNTTLICPDINSACKIIENGGVLAYPTEAVYGLGCDPFNAAAVKRIRQLKQRNADDGFICIASDWREISDWILPLSPEKLEIILKSWPGPNTWIFPASVNAPKECIAKDSTIAIRITAHPLAKELCHRLKSAIVSTSANTRKEKPARNMEEVQCYFADQIDGILTGHVDLQQKPSTIRDALTGHVLR